MFHSLSRQIIHEKELQKILAASTVRGKNSVIEEEEL